MPNIPLNDHRAYPNNLQKIRGSQECAFQGLLIKDICTVLLADMSCQYYLALSKGDPYSTYGQKSGFLDQLVGIMVMMSLLLSMVMVDLTSLIGPNVSTI